MTRRVSTSLVAGALVVITIAGTRMQATSVVAFENVTVVPMDSERVLRDYTVVVRDQRIVSMGPSGRIPVPSGARRVDGRGRYLMPGLADMHVHPYDTDQFISYLAHGMPAAIRVFEWNADVFPESHGAHAALAQALLARRDTTRAVAAARRTLEIFAMDARAEEIARLRR